MFALDNEVYLPKDESITLRDVEVNANDIYLPRTGHDPMEKLESRVSLSVQSEIRQEKVDDSKLQGNIFVDIQLIALLFSLLCIYSLIIPSIRPSTYLSINCTSVLLSISSYPPLSLFIHPSLLSFTLIFLCFLQWTRLSQSVTFS